MNRKFYSFTKRLAAVMVAAAVSVGCNVDDSYDLSNVDSDFGMGTDETQFYLPLISVNIDPSQEINSSSESVSIVNLTTKSEGDEGDSGDETETTTSSTDIFSNLDKVNAFLPNREEGIDLSLIATDDAYLIQLVEDLLAEILTDDDKCLDFIETVNDDSDESFAALQEQMGTYNAGNQNYTGSNYLGATLDEDETGVDDLQNKLTTGGADAIQETKDLTFDLIRDMVDENCNSKVEAGQIDVASDTISMLNKNLDGNKNKLYLFATFETDMDVNIVLDIKITYNGKQIDVPAVNAAIENAVNTLNGEEELDGEALDAILANLDFDIKFYATDYDPNKGIDTTGKYIKLTFIALKTGSLIF